MNWDAFYIIENLVTQSAFHWVCSAFAGLLAFSLTMTISCAVCSALPIPVSRVRAVNYFIHGLALCFALLAAWSAHVSLDGLMVWWVTPLATPLNINTDPLRYMP